MAEVKIHAELEDQTYRKVVDYLERSRYSSEIESIETIKPKDTREENFPPKYNVVIKIETKKDLNRDKSSDLWNLEGIANLIEIIDSDGNRPSDNE